MFIQGQDFIKKELAKCFPIEDFAQIDDIFLEENENKDKDGQDDERSTKDNPSNSTSNIISIDKNLIEAWEETTDDVHPAL